MDNVEYLMSTYLGEEMTYWLINWYEHHPTYTLEALQADESKADLSGFLTPYVTQAQMNLAEEADVDIDFGPAFVAGITGLGRNDPDGSLEPDDRQSEAANSYAMSTRPSFKSSGEHFRKHGDKMGYTSTTT